MTDRARAAFERMDDQELLATAAFFADEYTPAGLAALKAVAAERGISDEVVRAHRAAAYPEVALIVTCEACGCGFLLDEESFTAGSHTCPDCNERLPVRYLGLTVPPSLLEMAKDALRLPFAFGILGMALDTKKEAQRRAAILDGSYWEQLRQIKPIFSRWEDEWGESP